MTTAIKFGRGVKTKYGSKLYTSKCGKYVIEGKYYIMPFSSMGYNVVVANGVPAPRMYYTSQDTLSDAKEWCNAHANPSND